MRRRRKNSYSSDSSHGSRISVNSNITFVVFNNNPEKEEELNKLRNSFSQLQEEHDNYVNKTIQWQNSVNERINLIRERDNEEYNLLENRHNNYVQRTNREMERLNDRIEQYQDDLYQSSLDYDRLKGNYNDLLDEKYNLKNQIENLKKNERENQNDLNNLQNNYNNLQTTFNNFQNQSNVATIYLNNELLKYKNAYEVNMGKFYELDAQYRVLWQQRDSLLQENSNLREKNEELRKLLQIKEIELNELKQKNEYYKNKSSTNYFKEGQMNIKFISMDGGINTYISCSENDKFSDVEEKLLQKNPAYKGKNNICVSNGIKIIKSQTIKENGITSDSSVMLMSLEENNESSNDYNFQNYETNNTENYDNILYNNAEDNLMNEYNFNDNNFEQNNMINNDTNFENNGNIFNDYNQNNTNYINIDNNNYITYPFNDTDNSLFTTPNEININDFY